MLSRLTTVLPALAAAMLLTSCLDYEEDLVIHKDLSGEVALVITLPDSLVSKYDPVHAEFTAAKMTKRFEGLDGITLEGYELVQDRKPLAKIKFSFKSLDKLNEAIAKNAPASILGGTFTVKKEGDKTVIERKLGEGTPTTDLPDFNYAQYKTHFDGTIANTNSGHYNSMGQDVRYRYKLTELLAQKPVQMTTLVRPKPWAILFSCIAVLAGAAYYGWKLLGKKKVPVH
ncbi:MAG: hypothetical protein ACAI34_23910 [Verrucomicrobium sp.]